jgi:glycosyltransferase involved in cell wall biosynthesis
MAMVTVGVPVYNGAETLEKSLACIRDQTYRDIEVLIFDNCSEDATPDIAQRFCAEDPRFRYFRQPENRGADRNFLDALEMATTQFFMWRAADDTSDLNYIEMLLRLLLGHPERDIAVPQIVSVLPDGRVTGECRVSPSIGKGGLRDRYAQLFRAHSAWFYGLYRRDAVIPVYQEVMSEYGYYRGSDNLIVFPFQFDGRVIGTNATAFYQYLRYPEAKLSSAERAVRDDEKIERGRAFGAIAHRYVSRKTSNLLSRTFYHGVVAYFIHKRAYSLTKRLRRKLVHILKPATSRATG